MALVCLFNVQFTILLGLPPYKREKREFIFYVILILYASLSNYYKTNSLLQLLD